MFIYKIVCRNVGNIIFIIKWWYLNFSQTNFEKKKLSILSQKPNILNGHF